MRKKNNKKNRREKMPINYKEYHPLWKTISRSLIKNRADSKCELCGAKNKQPHWKTRSKVVLTVHHIDGDKKTGFYIVLDKKQKIQIIKKRKNQNGGKVRRRKEIQ